jgi:hypothetical protein
MRAIFPDSVVLDGVKSKKKKIEMHHRKSKIAGDGESTTTLRPQLHRSWRIFL